MLQLAMFILGGIARAYGGMNRDNHLPIPKIAYYLAASLLSAYSGATLVQLDLLHLSLLIWAALIASLNLAMGRTKLLEKKLPPLVSLFLHKALGQPKWDEKHQSHAWDWDHGRWMAVRFGLPSLVLVAPLIPQYPLGSACYLAMAVASGLFFQHRQKAYLALRLDRVSQWLHLNHNLSWLDSSRLAEFVAGACILGGLSIL